jgi:hypothetical protein
LEISEETYAVNMLNDVSTALDRIFMMIIYGTA